MISSIARYRNRLFWVMFLYAWVLAACSPKKDPKKDDTLNTGDVYVVADEAYRTILEDQRFLFEIKYPKSTLNILYTSEDRALDMILSDSVRLAVVSCEPGERELAFFKSKGLKHYVNHIANDAVVLAVNKNCPLEKLTIRQLKQLINGEITQWEQLVKSDQVRGQITLAFNMQGSGIINYFRKYYLEKGKKFPANSGTFKNTLNLLDSLAKYPSLIGFIPYNFISDKDDSLARAIKQNFKILSLQSLNDTAQFVLPSQASIADSAYPLIRKVLVINREGKSGLGTGFVIFMASHKGQRVMLKAGMVPAVMPGREVRIIKKNLQY